MPLALKEFMYSQRSIFADGAIAFSTGSISGGLVSLANILGTHGGEKVAFAGFYPTMTGSLFSTVVLLGFLESSSRQFRGGCVPLIVTPLISLAYSLLPALLSFIYLCLIELFFLVFPLHSQFKFQPGESLVFSGLVIFSCLVLYLAAGILVGIVNATTPPAKR